MMRAAMNNRETSSLKIPGQLRELFSLGEFVTAAISKFAAVSEGADIDIAVLSGDFQLAIHEVCTNTIVHAYKEEGDLPILITLAFNQAQQEIVAEVIEYGVGYNPQEIGWPPAHCWTAQKDGDNTSFILGDVPDQDLDAESGRGIYLLNLLLDFVKYHPQADKNCWILVKNI